MAHSGADIDRLAHGRSSPSSSKTLKRKKRIEDLVASCSEDIAKLEQGAAIEVAASDHATRLLIARAAQSTCSNQLVGPPSFSQQSKNENWMDDGARQIASFCQTADASQGPKEAWCPQAQSDFDNADPELPASPLLSELLHVLCQDNTALESNLRDYEIALSSVLEEVTCLRKDSHKLESTLGQISQLRDLLTREISFTSKLREQNAQLQQRPTSLLSAIRQTCLTKDDKHSSLIKGLMSENNALRRLVASAGPLDVVDSATYEKLQMQGCRKLARDALAARREAAHAGLVVISDFLNIQLECFTKFDPDGSKNISMSLGAVKAQVVSAKSGITLHARDGVGIEQTLLDIPLSVCIRSSEGSDAKVSQLFNRSNSVYKSKHAYYGMVQDFQLAIALILALDKGDKRAKYFQTVAPLDTLEGSSMLLWARDDIEDTGTNSYTKLPQRGFKREVVLSGSAAYRRAISLAQAVDHVWRDFNVAFSEDLRNPVSRNAWFWAFAVVESRAILFGGDHLPTGGEKILCPVMDLANHRSLGKHTADVSIGPVDGTLCVRLAANSRVEKGDEITIRYNPEADYLDMFKRFGFWDADAGVHTVEVQYDVEDLVKDVEKLGIEVNQAALGSDGVGSTSFIREQAANGYDESLKAWWVPDYLTEKCPLFQALIERCRGIPNSKPEVEAARFLAIIVDAQLSRYGTTLEEDERSLRNYSNMLQTGDIATEELEGCRVRSVLELGIFEKRFLRKIRTMCNSMG